MKTLFIIHFISAILFSKFSTECCITKPSQEIVASVELITEYEVGNAEFFMDNNKDFNSVFPQYIFYKNDELYMYNLEKTLNVLNIKTKVTYTYPIINSILKNERGITGFYVKGDSILVGCSCKKIIIFSRKNQSIIDEISFPSCLTNFTLLSNNTILAFNYDELFKKAPYKPLITYSTRGFIPEIVLNFNDTIAVSNGWGASIRIFTKQSQGESIMFKLPEKDGEFVYFSAITKLYYVWLKSSQNGFWIVNRYNQKVESVLFEEDFLKHPRETPLEDSRDGIRIVSIDDHNYLFVIMKNNKIQVYKVTIPI